jgi:hypothetical protein
MIDSAINRIISTCNSDVFSPSTDASSQSFVCKNGSEAEGLWPETIFLCRQILIILVASLSPFQTIFHHQPKY